MGIWAPDWVKFGYLGPVKVSGSYSSASWAKLELSQAMSGHVEAVRIFRALPPAGPRF